MQVNTHLLYKLDLNSRNLPPDPNVQHRMMDKIICARDNVTIPMGMKRTIIDIQEHNYPRLNMYEILFDEAFPGKHLKYSLKNFSIYKIINQSFVIISRRFHITLKLATRCFGVLGDRFYQYQLYELDVVNENNVNKVNAYSPSWRQSQSQHQQQQSPYSNRFFNSDDTNSAFNQPRKADQSCRQLIITIINVCYSLNRRINFLVKEDSTTRPREMWRSQSSPSRRLFFKIIMKRNCRNKYCYTMYRNLRIRLRSNPNSIRFSSDANGAEHTDAQVESNHSAEVYLWHAAHTRCQ